MYIYFFLVFAPGQSELRVNNGKCRRSKRVIDKAHIG